MILSYWMVILREDEDRVNLDEDRKEGYSNVLLIEYCLLQSIIVIQDSCSQPQVVGEGLH